MIGILLTGHGEFAYGLHKSLTMIAGQQAHVTVVNFEDGMNLQEFQEKIKNVYLENAQQYKGTLVLTDLLGGTPFNTAVLMSESLENIQVVAGTNLAMLIEGSMQAMIKEDVETLADELIQVGKDAIVKPQFDQSPEEEDLEGGI